MIDYKYETFRLFIVYNINEIPICGEVLKIYLYEFIIRELTNTKIEVLEMKMPN